METITICGSTKFKNEMREIEEKFTLCGNIVLPVSVYLHSKKFIEFKQKGTISDELYTRLRHTHLLKIDMSNSIFVVNKNKYIGENTIKEIEYARLNYKNIYYLEDPRDSKYLYENQIDFFRSLKVRDYDIKCLVCREYSSIGSLVFFEEV